ncbi:MAG: family N-acetyltransferase, partial [Clostridia bacterium]|nr:family N-acetyltransferase [Clostridia bacterium]
MTIESFFKKLNDQEIAEFIKLGGLAYPFMNLHTTEDVQKQADRYIKMQNEDPNAKLYGAYRNNELVGGMQLQDFTLNFDGTEMKAGGVGFVAVDLLHKKERIAKDIISYFIDYYRKQKVTVAMLYPFRPDFYKQMGFGFGTKMNQYRIRPEDLPKTKHKENIAYLTEGEKAQWIDCYNSFAAKTHGMIKRTNIETNNIFAPGKTTIVYKKDNKIEGYLSFFFKKASEVNQLKNDIILREFVYHDLEVFHQLLNFLHTQLDQIDRIVINTQDEYFHYLLKDPRDGSGNNFAPIYEQTNLQGVGLMYRIIDTEEFFRQTAGHNFNNQSIKLKLNIVDSFVEENSKPVIIEFKDGKPLLIGGISNDAEITMDISDFSAMAMGCVEFRALL